ncbi:chorismate mutase [Streptomyces sp. NRRL F-2664]|uniref:chorismate mutase n=1 Tax=Streptomyces sp. NRRL F-2664 TaxID=1463842 RepID=UPI00068F009B|nr:chorismate mutase [Streptomyces sp. NRRL F-2664]
MNATPEEVLRPFRERLETLDQQLAELVAARLTVCCEVAEVKRTHGIPMMQPHRVTAVREAYAARGERLGLSPDFMRSLATLLIDEACRLEDEIIDAPAAAGTEALR